MLFLDQFTSIVMDQTLMVFLVLLVGMHSMAECRRFELSVPKVRGGLGIRCVKIPICKTFCAGIKCHQFCNGYKEICYT